MKKILVLFAIFYYSVNATAQCTSGDCENGFGTYVFPDGNTYTGSWKNGKRDGKGTFTWSKGDVYTGDWVADEKMGSGINNYAGGQKYVGKMYNGVLEGEGTYLLASGYYMKGIFKNNIGVDVKYFDDKNIEISSEKYDESEKNDVAKRKEKLQIQNITIPAPNGLYSLTDRASDVKMQFCTSSQSILCLWGNNPTFYNVKDTKKIGHSTYGKLLESEIGREILADINKSSSTTNTSYSPYFNKKGEGYATDKFQIKINNGKPFDMNNNDTYTVMLYNYQKFIEEATLPNFSFWKDENERKDYHKKEKEAYFDFYEDATSHAKKTAKEEYEENSKKNLTDIHASYDSIKSMAHIVFTFSHYKYDRSYNLMYDIDFKNKTYKKIGESDYKATVNDGCYSFITSITPNKIETKKGFLNYRIINFEDNSTIDIDKAYMEKLNNLTNPPGDVEFVTANKEYIIFKSNISENNRKKDSYYFVNKKNNFCEKIINIYNERVGDIVFNSDFSMAACNQKYKLNPNDSNLVNSVYILDLENLAVKLLDDNVYQMEAINNKIIQDKESADRLSAWYVQHYAERDAIESRNAAIENRNAQAQAERTAKCLCCHGTGQQEVKGMYMGNKTYSVTPVNGLGISHEESVATYGQSTYSPCSCCKIKN